ncbi:hypothetical protein QBC39DRAFT_334018 [Podospora conica]|nr:hypothetical protein QBC39DRAFT_334018 [Schizothecium conicum]
MPAGNLSRADGREYYTLTRPDIKYATTNTIKTKKPKLPDNLNINLAKFKYRNIEEQARFEVLLKILQRVNGYPTGTSSGILPVLAVRCKYVYYTRASYRAITRTSSYVAKYR